MISTLFLLCAAFLPFLTSCSLFNQELPNEPPKLLLSKADTTQVARGGTVNLSVRASDEDDDPLSYSWTSFGEGSFRDSTSGTTAWIAPDQINGNTEFFLLSLTVSDHQPETEDITQTFLIEVIQRPPSVTLTADTTIAFSAPFAVLQVSGADPDGDNLEYTWEQLTGPRANLQVERLDNQRSRVRFVPLLPGEYRLAARVSDGADTAGAEIVVQVPTPPAPPLSGTIPRELNLPDGSSYTYQIDAYEYPNQRDSEPTLASSFFRAAELCAIQGRRLCLKEEWRSACQGADLRRYSSSDDLADLGEGNFGLRFCNTPNSEKAGKDPDPIFFFDYLVPAGSHTNCSTDGVYDLTGNVAEWVWVDSSQTAATYTLTSVLEARECGEFAEPLPTLPVDFDFSTQAINGLGPDYQAYLREDIGFRCCQR